MQCCSCLLRVFGVDNYYVNFSLTVICAAVHCSLFSPCALQPAAAWLLAPCLVTTGEAEGVKCGEEGGKQHWHIWNPKLTNLLLSIASSCFLILWLDVEIPIINSLSNWQKDLRATNQHMRREEEYTYILFLVSSMCIFQLPTVQNKVLISPTTFPTPRPQRCCEAQARVRQGSARDGP